MLCYYFRHTTDFIGQNTRGRSPHASLDINTTSNYCPVSLARVAQLVERRTPESEAPGSNPTNTQLFLCPRHKMARGHLVFALSVILSFRHSVLPSHQSLSSQLLLHPCLNLNETWYRCCTTSLEVHVGR